MTRLETLYMQWEDGSLDDEGVNELKQLMENNDNREALYELFETSAIIQETLIENRLSKQESAATDNRKPVLLLGQPTLHSTNRSYSPARRSLVSPPKSKSPLPWLAAAAAITLVIGLTTWHVRNGQIPESMSFAQVSAMDGNAYVVIDGQRNKLAVDSGISPERHVVTDRASHVTLTYADNTLITIQQGSDCFFENSGSPTSPGGNANGKRVKLVQGEIEAQVTKQPEQAPFTIATVDAQAVVLGTQLKVARASDQTRVDLYHGRVRFERLDGSNHIVLESGQYAIARLGKITGPFNIEEEASRSYVGYSLSLIDADINSSAGRFNQIKPGEVISLSEIGLENFNLRVNAPESVKKLRINAYFTAPGEEERNVIMRGKEEHLPFSVFGDSLAIPERDSEPGYKAEKAEPGSYRVVVVPYDDSSKPLGKPTTFRFRFVE